MKSEEYFLHENLPQSINYDNVRAPAEAIDKTLKSISPNVLLLYSRIDELPHELLDHLAYLCHADNYDSGYSLEIKRKIIKTAMLIHKYKGTKYAVETALNSIFNDAKVYEWFEYGGEPYTFTVTVRGNGSFNENREIKELIEIIESAKNVRSWLAQSGITIKFDPVESKIRLGFASVFSGYNKILLAAPEGVEYVLNTAIIPARTGLVRVGFEIANSEKLNLKFGSIAGVFGRKEIDINKDDLPDVFKERDSFITSKFGVKGAFRGVKKISVATPEKDMFGVGYAFEIANTGVRKYGLDPPESSNLNVGFGTKIAYNGERKINASLEDLPDVLKERDSYIASKLGIAGVFKGNKRIGISKPTKESLTSTVGFCYGIFGKTVVNASIDDLPEEFKEKTSSITVFVGDIANVKEFKQLGVANVDKLQTEFKLGGFSKLSGKKTISIASTTTESAKLKTAIVGAVTRRKVIGADLSDLVI